MSQFPARETLTQAAERAGATPAKLADPTEGAREGLTVTEPSAVLTSDSDYDNLVRRLRERALREGATLAKLADPTEPEAPEIAAEVRAAAECDEAREIDDDQIAALRSEAAAAGDAEQVALCDLALYESAIATAPLGTPLDDPRVPSGGHWRTGRVSLLRRTQSGAHTDADDGDSRAVRGVAFGRPFERGSNEGCYSCVYIPTGVARAECARVIAEAQARAAAA